jgi:iron complex outermembrane receptor protein
MLDSGNTARCMAAALGIGLAWAPNAMAADAQDSQLQEIVVTARRVEERLQNVPISISVFNQRQLTDRNIATAGDLATYTPSLSVNSEFGSENEAFSLRGFTKDIGTSPTVGVYFADVVRPRGGFGGTTEQGGEGAGPGNFFDLENVQVLKGPQGTLFGRNTTGGAILLVPQKPTSELGGYFEASGGNYGMERLQGVLNVPLNEKLRLRAGFDQQQRDGYLINTSGVGPGDFDDINYIAGRVSLVAEITDDIENYTIGSFAQSDTNGPQEQMFACDKHPKSGGALLFAPLACAQIVKYGGGDPYAIQNEIANPRSYLREWQIINTTTWDVADHVSVKNIASYSQHYTELLTSLFGAYFTLPSNFPKVGGSHLFFTSSLSPLGLPTSDEQTFTEELQAHGDALDGKLRWTAGLYMEGSHPVDVAGTLSPNAISCTDAQALQCTDVIAEAFGLPTAVGTIVQRQGGITWRNYGIYGQTEYAFTDWLKLETGLRYTDDSETEQVTRYEYVFPIPNTPVRGCEPPLPNGNCLVPAHTSSRAPTGLINLMVTPVEDVNAYIQYARGYRQGGLLTTGPIGFLTYQPEQVDAYELGVKSSFRGEISGVVNGALFFNDLSNQQILGEFNARAPGTPLNAGIVNAGSARIWGFELESTISPHQGLTLSLAYTYLNSRLDSAKSLTIPTGPYTAFYPASVPGAPLALTPRNKASFNATYRLPVDETLGKISFGVTYTYTGSQLVQSGGPYAYIPSYDLLNLNLNWESIAGGPVDAEFFMTNVAGNYYASYVNDFIPLTGFAMQIPGEPRMFGGRVRVHF